MFRQNGYHGPRISRLGALIAVVLTSALGISHATRVVANSTQQPAMHSDHHFANFKVPKIQGAPILHKESGPFVDGAENPELIPDEMAIRIFSGC